jgi:hypothetical protein
MNALRSSAFVFLSFLACAAQAGDVDISRCSSIAQQYSQNPFAASMGDLDTLRVCVGWQMNANLRSGEEARISRAIERNFGVSSADTGAVQAVSNVVESAPAQNKVKMIKKSAVAKVSAK